jgi:hypothetical protein
LAQEDMNVGNGSGAVVRADLNAQLEALVTNNSGNSAPSPTFPNMWWPDLTNGLLKQRNGANTDWIIRGVLSEEYFGIPASAIPYDPGSPAALSADNVQAAIDELAAGVEKICFRAHKNGSDQTLTSATTTDITFGSEDFDIGGYFNTSTGRFTPPAGKYRLTAVLYYSNGLVDQSQARTQINKNGSAEAVAFISAASTGGHSIVASAIVEANGTDYFSVVGRAEGAGDKTINGGRTLTYFCGEKI